MSTYSTRSDERRPKPARRGGRARPRGLQEPILDKGDLGIVALVALTGAAVVVAAFLVPAARHASAPPVSEPIPLSSATPSATPPPGPVVVIGDGFATGSGPKAWTGLLAAALKVPVEVTSDDGLAYTTSVTIRGKEVTFGTAASSVAPAAQAVVLVGGANDTTAGALPLVQAVAKAVNAAKSAAPDAKVIVVGPDAPVATDALLAVRDAMRSAANVTGATFVDPVGRNWVPAEDWLPDGLHPTDAGQARVASRMTTLLKDALGS